MEVQELLHRTVVHQQQLVDMELPVALARPYQDMGAEEVEEVEEANKAVHKFLGKTARVFQCKFPGNREGGNRD